MADKYVGSHILAHPLAHYHPEAQKAFKAMRALESKPHSAAEYKKHENTFKRHASLEGFASKAWVPKGKPGGHAGFGR